MASVISVALRKPIIPFKPVIPHPSYQKILLTEMVNVGTAAAPDLQKKKEEVFFCERHDVEYILRTILEFQDVCSRGRLNIRAGPAMYNAFRKCLGGAVRDTWDVVMTPHPNTVDGFNLAKADFIAKYIKPTGLADQRLYLQTYKKPTFMGVRSASARLLLLNKMMRLFPSSGDALPLNANDMKYALYNIMPIAWQRDFSKTTQQITDAAYTYDMLTDFFIQ